MLPPFRKYLEMIRFSHTVFALPFALVSTLLAWRIEPFRWLDLVGIVVCMVLARSTAMAFNRLVDRRFDAANPRTASRHLPTGQLSVAAVTAFTIFCALGFVAATGLFWISNGNWLPLALSVPVLGFICGYSLSKRFTAWSHVWLGASLMLAPLAAWIAIRGPAFLIDPVSGGWSIEWPPILLGLVVLTWVAGFDILYACQDVDFDRQVGLHSIPARLGVVCALHLAAVFHLVMVGFLLALGLVADLGAIYYVGVAVVAVLLAYEHWLVRPDDLTRVNRAFFHVNSVISVGLLVIVTLDLWLGK